MLNKSIIKKIANTITPPNTRLRIGVLVSGQGGNLQALIDFAGNPSAHFAVTCVISNNPDMIALKRAEKAGIPHHFIDHKSFSGRAAFEQKLMSVLDDQGIDLIVLAGFLRVLSPKFVSHYHNRIINLHPSLLPHFPGLHAIEQALKAGVLEAGCTVHLVDEGLDTGEIIAQRSCAVEPLDTLNSLSEKIHRLEHELLPFVVNEIAFCALQ